MTSKTHSLLILIKKSIVISLLLLPGILMAQNQQIFTYKKVGGTDLKMEVRTPSWVQASDRLPAMIFFFGGGWETGNRTQFNYYANDFVKKGIITVLVDYRISTVHGTTPFEALKDAKSAMRYLKEHGHTLNIDTARIIASGGSAGGHLAAACQTNTTINEATDNMSFSPKPRLLVLYNPAVDNSPDGYGADRLGNKWREFSPMHNIKAPFPPTIFFLGTKDHVIPVSTAQEFKSKIEAVGGRCDVKIYQDVGHGFFNNEANRDKVIKQVDEFLRSTGYQKNEDYPKGNAWLDIDFTRDSLYWEQHPDKPNFQLYDSLQFEKLVVHGQMGRFSNALRKLDIENLNKKFVYSLRLSNNKKNGIEFPWYENIGTLKIKYLNTSSEYGCYLQLQRWMLNQATGKYSWVDINPPFKHYIPPNDGSSTCAVFEHTFNLPTHRKFRLMPIIYHEDVPKENPPNFYLQIYSIQISKDGETLSELHSTKENNTKIITQGRSIEVSSPDFQSKIALYNMAGSHLGNYKTGERIQLNLPGIYMVHVHGDKGYVSKKIAIL